MLTRAGWALVVAAVGVLVSARAFGVLELYVIGALLVALAVGSVIFVRATTLRMRLGRTMTPTRVHSGDSTRIEIAATNSGRARTPVLRLRDPVGGTKGAQINLAPLRSGQSARAAYRLPTARRGVIEVGPLTVEINDPFGLARRQAVGAPAVELTVFPYVEELTLPRPGGDHDPHGASIRANNIGRQGEEFYGLRPYVVGDDLRRVHWPSTARNDELMMRQDEVPWQDRTTVVLDVRRNAHSPESFEKAVSTAASFVTSTFHGRHVVRLLTTGGADSTVGAGLSHVDAIMEYLAGVSLTDGGSMRAVVETLQKSHGGLLVVSLGRAIPAEMNAIDELRRHYRAVVAAVHLGRLDTPIAPRSMRTIDVSGDASLSERWNGLPARNPATAGALS